MRTPEESQEIAANEGTTAAPDDQVWVCGACGKTSRTKYGFLKDNKNEMPDGTPVASQGWDESCMMNAVLCDKEKGDDGHYWPAGTRPAKE